MKILLTIKKEKHGLVWGHVFIMGNLLIENARTVEELKAKCRQTLINYYELENECFEFSLVTGHIAKARQMVLRLAGSKTPPEIEVHFNSQYFT